MDRHAFIGSLAGGLLPPPLAAEAQQPAKAFRLGLLGTVPLTDPGASRVWDGFLEGLRPSVRPLRTRGMIRRTTV